MRLFFKHIVDPDAAGTLADTAPRGDTFMEQATRAVEILCDEARLDPIQ
jgi:hypothetical protein